MLRILLITFLLISGSYCQTPVRQCPDDVPAPTSVNVIGCETSPCSIVTGTPVIMFMDFISPLDIDTLGVKVIAKALGIDVPYPLPEPDACKSLTNTHCPLEINEPAQYKLEMPVLTIFPEISITLTFFLEANGENNKTVCFVLDAQVVKP